MFTRRTWAERRRFTTLKATRRELAQAQAAQARRVGLFASALELAGRAARITSVQTMDGDRIVLFEDRIEITEGTRELSSRLIAGVETDGRRMRLRLEDGSWSAAWEFDAARRVAVCQFRHDVTLAASRADDAAVRRRERVAFAERELDAVRRDTAAITALAQRVQELELGAGGSGGARRPHLASSTTASPTATRPGSSVEP